MANPTAQVPLDVTFFDRDQRYWPVDPTKTSDTFYTNELMGMRWDTGYAFHFDDSTPMVFLGQKTGDTHRLQSDTPAADFKELIGDPRYIDIPVTSGTPTLPGSFGSPAYATDSGHVQLTTSGLTNSNLVGMVVDIGRFATTGPSSGQTGLIASGTPLAVRVAPVRPGALIGLIVAPIQAAGTAGAASAGMIIAGGSGAPSAALTGTVAGGAGSGQTITLGGGGAASSTGAAAGGAGGAFAYTAGSGGTSAGTSAGGAGGGWTMTLGAGGNASLTGTGGAGGAYSMTAGAGGTSTVTGGAGGSIAFTAGAGGNGTTASGAAGSISLVTGAAGTGGNVNGGNLKLTFGAKVGTGLDGEIEFVTQNIFVAQSSGAATNPTFPSGWSNGTPKWIRAIDTVAAKQLLIPCFVST